MKLMYLDESGDHNLTKIDPNYPVFVLGGVIVKDSNANQMLEHHIKQFKLDLFGRDDLILHTADIARNRNGFERLRDSTFRHHFYARLNQLMADMDYTVVACAIKKQDHLERYGINATDPYLFSLEVLIERFCFEIGRGATGAVFAERRNSQLDRQLELAWSQLTTRGTAYLGGKAVADRVVQFDYFNKQTCCAAAEIADLVVSPIGRYVTGRPVKDDFRIIESKLRHHRGSYHGAGLIVLPKERSQRS